MITRIKILMPLSHNHMFASVRRRIGTRRVGLSASFAYIKVRGPFVQTLCIEKDSYVDVISRVNIFR